MKHITPVSIFVSAVLVFLLDLPWLYINQDWAGPMILSIQGSPMKVRLIPALITYILLAYLLHIPKNIVEAFLLGVATYGVYDATNYATLKNYSPIFAVADTLWGGILMSMAWWIRNRYLKMYR
jgi:uncharacterized membrane protein|uniref:DUF2177 family protein n=1 Tax=viral metagenome TaxID=1070528 RepID=A0A6C0K4N8_9ZZZZ